MLNPSTHFSPIRMAAFARNEVEMEVSVKNEGQAPLWIEADVVIPEAISFAPDKLLSHGRMRIGIAPPNEKISKKVKVFGGASSYPDTYVLRLTIFGFGKDGTIAERCEMRADLRCEKV
jgi:hypothetical protein